MNKRRQFAPELKIKKNLLNFRVSTRHQKLSQGEKILQNLANFPAGAIGIKCSLRTK